MKRILFRPNVREELRAIEQKTAMQLLSAINRYAKTGEGETKPLTAKLAGLVRLRVRNYRIVFEENAEAITIHRVRDRKDAYR